MYYYVYLFSATVQHVTVEKIVKLTPVHHVGQILVIIQVDVLKTVEEIIYVAVCPVILAPIVKTK